MGLLLLLSFIRIDILPFSIRWNHSPDVLLRKTFSDRSLTAITLLFFIPFLSGIWSDDIGDWLRIVRIRLPFLLMPMAFVAVDKWPPRAMQYIATAAMVTALGTIPFVLYHFISSYGEVLESLIHGKMLWTPAYHIRYSLLLAYTALLGLYYYVKLSDMKWRRFFLIGSTVTIIFLHFLAVRSGLFVLYAVGIGYFLYEMVTGRHRWKMAGGFVGLLLLPVIGILTIPSLHQKWKYMRWDLEHIAQGEVNQGSDNKRILSFKGGLKVFKSSPIIGVGAGDLKQKMRDYFVDENMQFSIYPHNQYIFTLASTGVLGMIFFLIAVLFPLFHNQLYRYPPALFIHVIILLSFLVENTLETSLGVAIYLFFGLVTKKEWEKINAANIV